MNTNTVLKIKRPKSVNWSLWLKTATRKERKQFMKSTIPFIGSVKCCKNCKLWDSGPSLSCNICNYSKNKEKAYTSWDSCCDNYIGEMKEEYLLQEKLKWDI